MSKIPLTDGERACLLRAVRRQRDALTEERDRLVGLDGNQTNWDRIRQSEIEAELVCLAAAISWLWTTN